MPKKLQRYRENLPKKSYKEKQEDYQWRESKHRKREAFHEDVYFGYEEYSECPPKEVWCDSCDEFIENKAIHISPRKAEELKKLVDSRRNLRSMNLNQKMKLDVHSTKETLEESNTTKVGENPGDLQGSKVNRDEASGNLKTQKANEDVPVVVSSSGKASANDELKQCKESRDQPVTGGTGRDLVSEEMEKDKESQQQPLTVGSGGKAPGKEYTQGENRSGDLHMGTGGGDETSTNEYISYETKIEDKPVYAFDGENGTLKGDGRRKGDRERQYITIGSGNNEEKVGKETEAQPVSKGGDSVEMGKQKNGEREKRKEPVEKPDAGAEQQGKKSSEGMFGSFRNFVTGIF